MQSARAAPDRLAPGESLPESETVFGLPMPRGMRLTRHFNDSAYVAGELDMAQVLEHVQRHVEAHNVEIMSRRTVLSRVYIKGDTERRLFRIEIQKTAQGSQIYVKNITPPPLVVGLSEAERWQRAGRKPDGTLLDPNSVY